MRVRRRGRWLLALTGPAALALGGIAAAPVPNSAASTTAESAASAPRAAADEPGSAVTVRIDPSYQQPTFEGWGTSLVWMANATGGYPDEIRHKLVDLVFGKDGLRLNIARYNVGGGNAPDVRTDYMKVGATMPGFWKAPPGKTHNDVDWWDPDNPADWNFDADANQRWWIDQIKDKVDRWEAFSNSPPYFQTVSHYVSGGFNASDDQIREDKVDDFATYLTRVVDHIEQAHGIHFDTIDPLNEPNTNFWGTQLGPDGQPTGGRQEGAHVGPALQQKVVQALHRALASASTHAVVSAPDETNPGIFTTDWNAYSADARVVVDQLNLHTYGTGQRTSARDLAKGSAKKLWMSEVEGTWGNGTSYTSMEPGLGMATHMVDDLRELEPSAWVLWQPIEDAIPQQASGGNWGSIHIPFNCGASDTLATCPIQTNTKFNTIRNFTHYIRPGDHLVKVDDTSSVAAVRASARSAAVVHVNNATTTRSVTLDLSGFGTVDPNATVTPVVSSADGALVRGTPVQVRDDAATLVVPAKSVTTFLVSGVAGVAKDAALVQPGNVYRLQGVQSGRSLAPSSDGTGVVIRTTDADSADQLWSVQKLTGGYTDRERYALVDRGNGKRLAVRDNAAVLESAAGGKDASGGDPAAQWMMSTTGDGTWTYVNVGTGRLLDVAGQATADGSPVSTFTPTSGSNQRWAVIDETVQGTQPVETYTVPGRTPTLPDTVTPVYRDGARGSLPVTWSLPPASRWENPGKVTVMGTATDPLGGRHHAQAVVTVDVFTATRPGRAKTYVGGQPVLPETAVGVGEHGGTAQLPVTWDAAPAGAYDKKGVVPLHGTASVVGASTVDATVRVQVTDPSNVNAALDDGVVASATFTEGGYSPDRLRNGDLTDKGWSNWKPGTKDPSDTVTFTLPRPRDLTHVVTYFYRDGTNISFPDTLKVQVALTDGSWVDASGDVPVGTEGSPVIDVPVSTPPATAVRVVMTARPSGYITASEIQVEAKAPGVSSDARASSIEVNGVPIAGFEPDTTSYQVVGDPVRSTVTATASDPYASVIVAPDVGASDTVDVTVTSEDGSQTRVYRVTFARH